MRKEVLAATVLFVILTISEIPVYAFVIGPNPSADDNVYEMYGPHVRGLNIIVYSDTTAEWTAMASNTLDLEDWALDIPHITLWSNNANGMVEANYGGEAGYYLLDVNNNATYAPSDAGPFVHNPTSELPLRQALAYAANRTDIVMFTGGLALPMYTVIPTYMAGYVNHDIDPFGSLSALSYDNYSRGGDPAAAIALLDYNGYTVDGSGWRIDPVSEGGTGAELNLIFYSRSGDRGTFGDHYNTILNNVLHIKTDYHSHVPGSAVRGPVFAQEYFNLYTGCWTGIGPDPDFMDDLYDGSNYYHPGSPPNYDGINYADLNANLTTAKLATGIAQGTAAVLDAQIRFAEHAAAVPLWCYAGVKCYKNLAVANGGQWKDLVNQKGVGVNSWWSTLSMKQVGNLYPNAFAYYGFSSTVTLQNIVYAQWYWDQEVVGRIYDGGAGRDPYTLATWVPQLYKNWRVGTWNDPSTGGATKTSVTITLRPDVYWSDGHPFTAADVCYTLVEISKDLLAKGFSPPWWYPTVQYMRSVEIIDDYNIQVLLDVQSVWAAGWVIGSVVIPKHIWKPIVDASTVGSTNPRNVDAVTPDPYVIGTGPFRWYSGVGSATGQTIVLVANSPGSSAPDPATGLTPIISPGYYFYNPIYVDVSPDNNLEKVNISPTAASVVSNVTITLRNMDTHDTLIVNKYVYVNGVLQGGFPHDVTLLPMAVWNVSNPYPADGSGHADVETLHLTLAKKTLTFVKVAVHVKGPSTVGDPQANPWISTWINVTLPIWVTVREDIAGTTLYDILGYASYPTWLKNEVPAPDLKVDTRDLSRVAMAYGSYPGQPHWDPVADVNRDYRIDMTDVTLIYLAMGGTPQDIAVTDVALSKKIVFQGYSVKTNVTLANLEGSPQDCSLSVLFGGNTTKTDSVSLDPGTSTTRMFDVFARAFLFEEVGRTPPSGSVSPQQGTFSIHGSGTYLNASTGTISGLPISGGIIDLYYSNDTLITHREVLVPPDSNGTVFTAGNYSNGLYVLGTIDGELCFLDDNGEYGELSVALIPVNDLKLDELSVTACTSSSDINLRRYSTDFRFPKGSFSVSAYVDQILGETNLANNNFTDGWIVVSMVGDLTGGTPNPWDFVPDGKVDGKDIAIVALCYGSAPGCPPPYVWNANCDVNSDAKVDGKDIAIVALHYGQADP